MYIKPKLALPLLPLLLCTMLCGSFSVLAADASQAIGTVLGTKGSVTARDGAGTVRELTRKSDIYVHDTIMIGDDGSAQVRMADSARIAFKANTEFAFDAYSYDGNPGTPDTALMSMVKGGFRAISGTVGHGKGDNYRVDTPYASIGIRGTTHEALLEGGMLYTGVYDGGTTVSNNQGSIDTGIRASFDYTVTTPGKAPQGLLEQPPVLANMQVNVAVVEPDKAKADKDAKATADAGTAAGSTTAAADSNGTAPAAGGTTAGTAPATGSATGPATTGTTASNTPSNSSSNSSSNAGSDAGNNRLTAVIDNVTGGGNSSGNNSGATANVTAPTTPVVTPPPSTVDYSSTTPTTAGTTASPASTVAINPALNVRTTEDLVSTGTSKTTATDSTSTATTAVSSSRGTDTSSTTVATTTTVATGNGNGNGNGNSSSNGNGNGRNVGDTTSTTATTTAVDTSTSSVATTTVGSGRTTGDATGTTGDATSTVATASTSVATTIGGGRSTGIADNSSGNGNGSGNGNENSNAGGNGNGNGNSSSGSSTGTNSTTATTTTTTVITSSGNGNGNSDNNSNGNSTASTGSGRGNSDNNNSNGNGNGNSNGNGNNTTVGTTVVTTTTSTTGDLNSLSYWGLDVRGNLQALLTEVATRRYLDAIGLPYSKAVEIAGRTGTVNYSSGAFAGSDEQGVALKDVQMSFLLDMAGASIRDGKLVVKDASNLQWTVEFNGSVIGANASMTATDTKMSGDRHMASNSIVGVFTGSSLRPNMLSGFKMQSSLDSVEGVVVLSP